MATGTTFPKGLKWMNKGFYFTAGEEHDRRLETGQNRVVSYFLYVWEILLGWCLTLGWFIPATIFIPLVFLFLAVYELVGVKGREWLKDTFVWNKNEDKR